jgi:TPR repeat protein
VRRTEPLALLIALIGLACAHPPTPITPSPPPHAAPDPEPPPPFTPDPPADPTPDLPDPPDPPDPPPDPLLLLQEGCAAQDARACREGGLLALETDPEVATALLYEGCQLADLLACEALAALARRPDRAEGALALLSLACDHGVPAACADAGQRLRDQGDPRADTLAARRFQEGCDLGDWSACRQLAWMMEKGRGLSADLPGAADLYERACEQKEPAACFGLSKMLAEGRGVDADPRRARALRRQACALGWQPACDLN